MGNFFQVGLKEKKLACSDKKNILLTNFVLRIPSFYIRTKARWKNRVTTVHLLQCKTNIIRLSFWGRNLRKLKNIHLGKPPLISKKIFLIRLHSSTLVYIRLDLSSDLSALVYIHLDSSSNSSTLFYTRLDSSSGSSVFLEQIVLLKACKHVTFL